MNMKKASELFEGENSSLRKAFEAATATCEDCKWAGTHTIMQCPDRLQSTSIDGSTASEMVLKSVDWMDSDLIDEDIKALFKDRSHMSNDPLIAQHVKELRKLHDKEITKHSAKLVVIRGTSPHCTTQSYS